jgi:hypothetical protein
MGSGRKIEGDHNGMLEMSDFAWILRGAAIHRASLSYLNQYEFTGSDLF